MIYVWFEMCPGYLAAAQQAADEDDVVKAVAGVLRAELKQIEAGDCVGAAALVEGLLALLADEAAA